MENIQPRLIQRSWTLGSSGRRAIALHRGRFARFGLVGLIGVGVNTLLLTLMVEVLKLNYLPAAVVATEATIIANFSLNDTWTFRTSRAGIAWFTRLKRYNLIALGGMVISLLVLMMLSKVLGIHYVVANLFGIGAATLWNYSVNARMTYRLRGHGTGQILPMDPRLESVLVLADSSRSGGNLP